MNISELTPQQLNKIMERQQWLESWKSPVDLEYEAFHLGGKSKFYKKHLWDFLGLSELAEESEAMELKQDEMGNLFNDGS